MKKNHLSIIVLLLAFSFCGRAQETIRINDFDNEWAITFQDIMKYKQECYNDSVTRCFDRYGIVYYNENEEIDWPNCQDRRWTHRTCTFEGFIKWLEHKYRGALPKQK